MKGAKERPKPFELIAGHPALDFVNTLDWRFRGSGPEELLPGYDDLLRFSEQCGLVSPAQARRLVRSTSAGKGASVLAEAQRMREAAARIFYAVTDDTHPPPAAIEDLERSYRVAEKQRHLKWNENRLAWQFGDGAVEAEFPLWILALRIVELLSSEDLSMIRACGNRECRWVFLDASKNHTRRWCDMKICGNRMKARRFKAQRSE